MGPLRRRPFRGCCLRRRGRTRRRCRSFPAGTEGRTAGSPRGSGRVGTAQARRRDEEKLETHVAGSAVALRLGGAVRRRRGKRVPGAGKGRCLSGADPDELPLTPPPDPQTPTPGGSPPWRMARRGFGQDAGCWYVCVCVRDGFRSLKIITSNPSKLTRVSRGSPRWTVEETPGVGTLRPSPQPPSPLPFVPFPSHARFRPDSVSELKSTSPLLPVSNLTLPPSPETHRSDPSHPWVNTVTSHIRSVCVPIPTPLQSPVLPPQG